MGVGTAGVADYVNTTSGEASGVSALYGLGGAGVVEQGITPPVTVTYIDTEAGDRLDAENGNNLITE